MDDNLQYPIGKFRRPQGPLGADERRARIDAIAAAPRAFRDAVRGLSDAQLDTPYRDGGWSVRQLAHHMPDSHMNAYMRTKLALTEDQPTVKPYDEKRWAELADSRDVPVERSLVLLEALHDRWVALLRSLSAADFARTVTHPEWKAPMSVDTLLALYAWHGAHHTAHVTRLRERMGW